MNVTGQACKERGRAETCLKLVFNIIMMNLFGANSSIFKLHLLGAVAIHECIKHEQQRENRLAVVILETNEFRLKRNNNTG